MRRGLHHLVVLAVLASGLAVPLNLATVAPAEASGFTFSSNNCRAGQTPASNNGSYTANNIRIEPVFANVFYADLSRGFDATYIGYRVRNTATNSDRSDVRIEIEGFEHGSTVVSPSEPSELVQTLGALNRSTTKTAYLMINATAYSTADQRHQVSVYAGTSLLAQCTTTIQGVRRSLAASANKVTGITVTGTPALGQTFTVTVNGAPGKIGGGSVPDASVFAMTAATSSSWPSRAIRLEQTQLTVRGSQFANSCSNADPLGSVATSTNTKSAVFTNTLVLRGVAASNNSCMSGVKTSYEAVYTFRVVGLTRVDPVIRPLASIASGTQVKYTGSLPATDVTVPFSTALPSVVKGTVAGTDPTIVGGNVRVNYEIVGTVASGASSSVFDAILDTPPAGATLVSVEYRDDQQVAFTALPANRQTITAGLWTFTGPFTATSARPVVIRYLVDLPIVTSVSTVYTNAAVGVVGDDLVGSGAFRTGVKVTVSNDGTTTTSTVALEPEVPLDQPQRITFRSPAAGAVLGSGTSTPLDAIADSGLAVTFVSTTTGVCTVSQAAGLWSVTILASATSDDDCTVRAEQAGDSTYAAATPVSRTFGVKPGQRITNLTPSASLASGPATLTLIADSKLLVTLASVDTDVCTVGAATFVDSGDDEGRTTYTVTRTSATVAGLCVLVASQPGDATWAAANELEITIGVGTPQVVSFVGTVPGDGDRALGATIRVRAKTDANDGTSVSMTTLPITFSTATPAVCRPILVAGGDLIDLVAVEAGTDSTVDIEVVGFGVCVVRASQDGTDRNGDLSAFAPTDGVQISFLISNPALAAQALEFNQPTTPITYGAGPFSITATSKKTSDSTPTNLLVAFSGTSGICSVSAGTLAAGVTTATVTVLGAGTCVLTASQAGNDSYNAAPQQTRSVVIDPKTLTITAGTLAGSKKYDTTTTIALTGAAGLAGVVAADAAAVELTGMPTVGTLDTMLVGTGKTITIPSLVTVSLAGSRAANYRLDATQTALAFATGTVTKRPLTITPDARTVSRVDGGTLTTCPVSDSTSAPDGLQGSDGIESPSDRPCVLHSGGGTISIDTAGSFNVTPTLAGITIRQAGVDVTLQYDITLGVGVLTVTSLQIPTMSASNVTLTYGDPFAADLLEADAKDGGATSLVTGGVSLTYSFRSGGALDARRNAGSHTIDITFPGNGSFAAQTISRTVTIQPRSLTITARSAVKVAGEADPSLTVEYSGFASGENESVLSGTVSVTRAAGETPGRYTLTPSGGTSSNYAITRTPAQLVIVGLSVGVQESGGVLTDRDVTCVCELLEPGTTATLTIFSTPTVIDTVTVDGDGRCPELGDTIPTSVPDGPHTLRLDGVADDGASTPVSLLRPVTLRTQVVSSGNGGGGGTPPAPPSTDEPAGETLSAPVVPPRRPAPLTPPADPTDGAPRAPTPIPTAPPAPPQPPRDQQAADGPTSGPLGGSAGDTFDLGSRSGPGAVAIPPGATLRQVLEVTRTAAARTLGELATESISGFAAGVGLRIEVIGARTTARFVLSATERIDTLVLSEALRRSAPTQATDFARISAVAPVERPAPVEPWSPEERAQADDLFAASRLTVPVQLSDLDIPADSSWIRIEMRGATYLPGSRVHLTVTSDPIVLASAVVERDGTVTIVGDLPVQILPAGEHRIRLVGTRLLGGVLTDAAGELVLTDEVLAEIERFDLGTDATVRIVGDNGMGGVHTVLRVVPLDPIPPWWTLWIVLAAWLVATGLRRRGRLGGMRRRVVAHALVVLAGVPAVVLGWLATTTVVVWWGAGLALLASALLGAIAPREDDREDAGPEPVLSRVG